MDTTAMPENQPTDLSKTTGPSPTEKELKDARAFVTFWFLTRNIGLDKRQKLIMGKKTRDEDLLIATLVLDYAKLHESYRQDRNNSKFKPLTKDILRDAFREKVNALKEEAFAEIKREINLAPREPGLKDLEMLAYSITGSKDEYYVNLLAHWIQQVKRKLNSVPVDRPLLLTIFGEQGLGKTEAILKLIAPLGFLASSYSIGQLMDERHWKSLESKYILFLDELMGSESIDMEKLKNMVTGKDLSYRELYGKSAGVLTLNASFIAASNKPMFEHFRDRTGNRRFAEIKTADKINWEIINQIDYVQIWRSVNLTNDYYSAIKGRLSENQQKNVVQDSIDIFIEDFGISSENSKHYISEEKINKTYQEWAKRQGYKSPVSRDTLIKSLIQRCSLNRKRVELRKNHKPWCLLLSSSAPLSVEEFIEKLNGDPSK